MANEHQEYIVAEFKSFADLIDRSLADPSFLRALGQAASLVTKTLLNHGRVLFAGNGGSAADAQHLAGELVSRFNFDRAPLAGIALTTDTSVLTAIGNDYGYEHVFSRQVQAVGRTGDVLVAISTSGRSPNILAACGTARKHGLQVIGFSGASGGKMAEYCDVLLCVPSDKTPLIQQVHLAAGHVICSIAERSIFGQSTQARE